MLISEYAAMVNIKVDGIASHSKKHIGCLLDHKTASRDHVASKRIWCMYVTIGKLMFSNCFALEKT